MSDNPHEDHTLWLKATIAKAVAAEREACAKLADEQARSDRQNAEHYAAMLKDADDTTFSDCAITAEVIAKTIRARNPIS